MIDSRVFSNIHMVQMVRISVTNKVTLPTVSPAYRPRISAQIFHTMTPYMMRSQCYRMPYPKTSDLLQILTEPSPPKNHFLWDFGTLHHCVSLFVDETVSSSHLNARRCNLLKTQTLMMCCFRHTSF